MEQFGKQRSFGNTKKTPSNKTNIRIKGPKKTRCWFFTWNNPKVDSAAQLALEFGELDYVFQLEVGESGTKHFQGVVRTINPCANYPIQNNKIHWERCRNWRKAVKYCSKLDTREEGPWTNIKNLKYKKTLRDPLRGLALYDWQKDLENLFEKDPEFRTIYWIWDQKGNSGKTSFARHIKIIRGDEVMYVNGCSRDIMCTLAKRLAEDIDIHIIFFGLTRQDADHMSYKSLEIFSDGIGFSGKYESADLVFNPPHVIVMANFAPIKEMISKDRWKVIDIGVKASPPSGVAVGFTPRKK